MKKDRDMIMWSVSLLVIGIVTVLLAGSNLVGAPLPDVAIRLFGIIDLIALPVFAYASVRRWKER